VQFATVTTIKTSVEATQAFVAYHLHAGVDRVYLFFDDPDDRAIPLLKDNERVVCVRCNDEYWGRQSLTQRDTVQGRQEANATHALQLARAADIDWLAHIDSDELLYSKKGSLRSLFAHTASDVDVLIFPVMEAAPQRMEYIHPFHGISLFKDCADVPLDWETYTMKRVDRVRYWLHAQFWRRRKQVATLAGCNHSNIIGRFLLGHMTGKSAVRTTAPVARVSNHRPLPEVGQTLQVSVASAASVLHYDCMGFELWKTKWLRRVQEEAVFDVERFAPLRKKQMRQIRTAIQQRSEQELTALYKRWYFIGKSEQRIMQGLGLVRHLSFAPSQFEMFK